jgi:hypothetical protein
MIDSMADTDETIKSDGQCCFGDIDRGGATVLKVGDKSFRERSERKFFSFCPPHFWHFGGTNVLFQYYRYRCKAKLYMLIYVILCYYIVSYILIHVQCYASQ